MTSINIIRKFISLSNISRIVRVKIGRFSESRIESYGKNYRYFSLRGGFFSTDLYILSYTENLLRLKSPSGSTTIKIRDVDEFLDSDDTSLVLQYGRNILDENVVSNINEGLSVSDFDEFLRIGG